MDKNAERAEKILATVCSCCTLDVDTLAEQIKQALDEACAEAVRETINAQTIEANALREQAVKEGIREGLRMAAGIAMKYHDRASTCVCDEENIVGVIAEKIEAKARGIK
jgi:hypothetical protein